MGNAIDVDVSEVAEDSTEKEIPLTEIAKAANLVLKAPESTLRTLFRKFIQRRSHFSNNLEALPLRKNSYLMK